MIEDAVPRVRADALRIASTSIMLTRAIEHSLRQTDMGEELGLSEVSVLRYVELGRDTPTSIARAMRIDPGRVTRLTDRLVALQLLRREDDAADRRRCLLRLTRQGSRRLQHERQRVYQATASLLEGLSEEELDALTLGVEAVRRELDSQPLE